jgi:hypothetical protein
MSQEEHSKYSPGEGVWCKEESVIKRSGVDFIILFTICPKQNTVANRLKTHKEEAMDLHFFIFSTDCKDVP